MKFEKKVIDLGKIHQYSTNPFSLEGVSDEKVVDAISASCGCTTVFLDGNVLKGELRVSGIPYHLQKQGYQDIQKTIRVSYTDASVDVITVKAQISRYFNEGE